MNVRKYSKKDVEAINNLGGFLHEKYNLSLNEFSRCLVLEDGVKLVGFVVYDIIYERAEIIDVIIDPLYRKKGYGTKIIKEVIKDIKKSLCKNITLEVNCKNKPAINLYKNVGFKIEALRKCYYNDEDAYLMKLDLS